MTAQRDLATVKAVLAAAGVGVYEPTAADLALPARELAAKLREREVRRRLWQTDLGRWRPRVER